MPQSLPELPPIAIDSKVHRLRRLRSLSRLLDNAIKIPGTGFRVGLDPLIGLIPGGGDTAGLVMSSYIVLEAAKLGASKSLLGQMVFNILLETIAGSVPVVGDVFDVAWKSNARNIQLLEQELKIPHHTPRRNQGFAIALILLLVLAFIASVTVSVLVIRWLLQAVAG